MTEMLQAEINLESQREAQIMELIESLKDLIASKEDDIKYAEDIDEQMVALRSKLRPGSGPDQLELLLEQKRSVVAIEKGLLEILNQCLDEMDSVLADTCSRAARIEEAKEQLVPPELKSDSAYEWTDIENIDKLLEEAAENVVASEARVLQLRQRIDEALLDKSKVEGQQIPENLRNKQFGLAVKKLTAGALATKDHDVVTYSDLENRDESELLGVLGGALGNTAQGAAKAAIFGLKAIFDTVTDHEVSEATNEVFKKSSAISKGILNSSGAVKRMKSTKDLTENEVLKDSTKSTEEVLDAVGKTGKVIVSNVGKKDSAQEATNALKETTQDLLSTFNAVSALTTKYLQKKRNKENKKSGK